ncbi:hypothetical protein HD599_001880 [Conyzicola lurida]|uniref:Uncharacterized protein n=1 Tax=Conyzicola lurida TaxID=1172621 RepID=A0A841AK16_9MICO|nr:hypothetical protein [Conyzicola lurida]MBB5843557.1 hypothetical protein [Conyzicola lurida]
MQTMDPSHEGAWPRDMVISIDQPSTLTLLLFVRSAWGLDANGVAPVEAEPDPGSTRAPAGLDMEAANARWIDDWARAFDAIVPRPEWISREPDALTLLMLEADSEGYFDWVASVESFWREGLDDEACWAWQSRLTEHHGSPEHDAVEWLVPVWRSGVTTIVELPFAGYYVRRLSRETIVVSAATRRDPQLYSLALSTL